MITAIGPILSALRNPWMLLLIACVAGAGGTGWYRMRWLDCSAGQAKAVEAAERKAEALANELVIAQAQAMATNEKIVTVYRDKVNNAPVTNGCGPAVHDALRGLHELGSGKPNSP